RGGAVAPDYFGDFSELLKPEAGIAIMSQGTAGDQHWMDYSGPKQTASPSKYAEEMAAITRQALRGVRYQSVAALGMLETEIQFSRRAPDQARLEWARRILDAIGDAPLRTMEQVYAREQVMIHNEPSRRLKLQALRIGDLGIAAFPAEVFAITGLKTKARSPFSHTFNIELANGAEGYIPPAEQHALGGYTTWPARTAALDVKAEPVMAEQLLVILERLKGTRRRTAHEPLLETAKAVLRSKPLAYWPMDDMEGTRLRDASPNKYAAETEGGVALYLDGHAPGGRAIHFAGGRMRADLPLSGDRYTVEFWFWNGMPSGARPVTGYVFSRGEGDRLALDSEARLIFENDGRTLRGKAPLVMRQWYHLKLIRTKNTATVLLNDEPLLRGEVGPAPASRRLWFGGCNTADASFEGKLDDIAVWAR
ncbi:MAG: LamG domain-containing protein, partial [Acidobacteriales bacterium]|nr:LamG domain-containing protein [Terriglobales bacterium]